MQDPNGCTNHLELGIMYTEMKKKKYVPETTIKNLRDDYDLGANIAVAFWSAPSQSVVLDLMQILGSARAEDIDEIESDRFEDMDKRYFECVSLLIVDTNVDGIDFSTPEKTREAFYADHLPWGIFHLAVLMYVAELSESYEYLKNLLRRAAQLSSSGTSKSEQENESAETS